MAVNAEEIEDIVKEEGCWELLDDSLILVANGIPPKVRLELGKPAVL